MSITLSTNRDYVYENAATITYSASFSLAGKNQNNFNFSGTIGGVSVSNNSGTVTIRNLSKGTSYSINGSITCTYTYQYDVWEEKVVDGETIKELVTKTTNGVSSASVDTPLIIFTHPGSLSTGATDISTSDKNIIANVLTANWVNNIWIPHFKAAYKWWYQRDINYQYINRLSVNQNDPIQATWFNECMKAMNTFGKGYSERYAGGPNGDIIYASTINQLNFSGKRLT